MRRARSFECCRSPSPLVNMSASWSWVLIYCNFTSPFFTFSLSQWYLMSKCLVRSARHGLVAIYGTTVETRGALQAFRRLPSITKFSLIAASRYRLRECTTPLAIRLLAPTRCYTHIVAMSDSGEPNRLNRFLTAVLARFQAAQAPWFPCTKKHKVTGPTFFRSRRTSGERCHPRRPAHRGPLLQPRAKSSLETEAPGCW